MDELIYSYKEHVRCPCIWLFTGTFPGPRVFESCNSMLDRLQHLDLVPANEMTRLWIQTRGPSGMNWPDHGYITECISYSSLHMRL